MIIVSQLTGAFRTSFPKLTGAIAPIILILRTAPGQVLIKGGLIGMLTGLIGNNWLTFMCLWNRVWSEVF